MSAQRGKGKAILVVSRRAWSFPAFMEVTRMGPSSFLIGRSWRECPQVHLRPALCTKFPVSMQKGRMTLNIWGHQV